jgi:YacP-like NYN domain
VLYLVDGYNVTKADPATRGLDLEDQRTELVRRLGARSRTLLGSGRVIVVFDGGGVYVSGRPAGPVEVAYSRSGEKADDVIVRLSAAEEGGVTIVTDDRGLTDRVRAARGSRETRVLTRSTVFDRARGQADPGGRGRRGSGTGGLGVPAGGKAITKELRDLWLTDGEE